MRVRNRKTRTTKPPRAGERAAAGWLHPALLLLACSLAALGLRLAELPNQPWVTIDGTEYIRFAESLRAGRPFVSVFSPGYPALIGLFQFFMSDRVLAAELVSVVCGALLPWPVWVIARRVVGPRWALLPAALVTVHPELIRYSAVTMSESAYMLALYGALALVAVGRALPAGLSIGAAFAVRPEALVPAVALAVRGVLRAVRAPERRPAALWGTAGFLALALPCWLYFHATLGEWTLTPKVEALRPASASYKVDEPRIDKEAVATEQRFGLVERFVSHGPAMLGQYPANALMHGRSLLKLWPLPLLLLSLWGLWRRRGLEAIPLLHVLAIPLLGLSEQPRFVMSALPALAILATGPMASAKRARLRVGLTAALLAGLVWVWLLFGKELLLPYDAHLGAEQDAGRFLSGISSPGDVVEDRKPFVAFYADRPFRHMPEGTYDAIIQDAVDQGVRYLALHEGVVRVFRPQLRPLIYDSGFREAERRLELVYVGGHHQHYDVFIFRVLQPGEARSGQPPRMDLKWLQR